MALLLDNLSQDLPSEYQNLLKEHKGECEKYLTQLLANDDILTDPLKTTTTGRTLIEEIAELDSANANINKELNLLTYNNSDMIIDLNHDLSFINENLKQNYTTPSINVSLPNIQFDNHHLKLLNSMDSILDILELPTLCKLCILQGNYQESLEIDTFVKSLVIRFPNIPIFKTIDHQIELELKKMTKGLIKLLNANIKQLQILKIFQILNKSYKDEQVLIKIYLNSRYKFIINETSSLKPLIKYNKFTYLKRFVEVYREHLYSSLSIYQMIFPDSILISQFITSLATLLCENFNLYLPESDEDYETLLNGLILQLIYLCKSLNNFHVNFEPIILTNLVYINKLFTQEQWESKLS